MHRLRLLFDKVIILYFLVGIVPLLIITSLFMNLSTSQFSDRIKETLSLQSQNYTDTVNAELGHLLSQIYAISVDDTLADIIDRFDQHDNVPYTESLFRSHLSWIRTFSSDISDFIYINENFEYMLSQRYSSITTAAFWESSSLRANYVGNILESNRITFFPPQNHTDSSFEDIAFYLGFPISNNSPKHPTGVLLIGISSQFWEGIPSNLQDSDMDQAMHNLVVDQNNTIIFCENHNLIGLPLSKYIKSYSLSEYDYTVTEQNIKLSPWQHLNYTPHTLQYRSIQEFQQNLYLMLIVLCVLVFLLISSVVVSQNIRIRSIAKSIVHYSGKEADYKIQMHSNSILQEIIDEFNSMTVRVQELVDLLREKERVIVQSLNQQRIAEIKTLEAQINPHFLYNTLNTISWAAIDKGEYEISEMICSIAQLLQYSIRRVDAPVYVSDEVEWLKNYMFLQEKRFSTLFHYEINLIGNIDNCMIYKLLLQPVIENSILHAFDAPSPHNKICISIEVLAVDKRLRITVHDNGQGISLETLQQFQNIIQNNAVDESEHIGFANTCSRVRAYYGNSASISVVSNSSGTTTTLIVPILFEANNEEDLST